MEKYNEFIEINSEIRFGKPCVKNTRISVYDVLGWLAAGMSVSEIVKDFPELTLPSVRACLAYAAQKERKARVAV